jgi:hypothetical protein
VEALAEKVDNAIKQYNSAELCRVDVLVDERFMWSKDQQLTGHSKAVNNVGNNAAITASTLN